MWQLHSSGRCVERREAGRCENILLSKRHAEWRRWIRLFEGCWSEMCLEEVSGTEWRADEERSVIKAEGKGVCYMCKEYNALWE